MKTIRFNCGLGPLLVQKSLSLIRSSNLAIGFPHVVRNFEITEYRRLYWTKKTTKMEAINTFIETNTSSQKLRKFDIIVGEFLSHQEGRLRDLREEVNREVEYIDNYMNISDVGDLLLKIACLCVNLVPTEKHYSDPKVLEYLNFAFQSDCRRDQMDG